MTARTFFGPISAPGGPPTSANANLCEISCLAAGLALGTLPLGAVVTLSFSCTVL